MSSGQRYYGRIPLAEFQLGDPRTTWPRHRKELTLLMKAEGSFNPIAAAEGGLAFFQATHPSVSGSEATRSFVQQAAAIPLPDDNEAESYGTGTSAGRRAVAAAVSALGAAAATAAAVAADPEAVDLAAAETAQARALTFTPEDDQRCLAIILLNCTPELRDSVDHATCAREAWLGLIAIYQDHSTARYDEVYTAFATAKQGQQETVQAYATRVTGMSRELSAHGGVHSMPALVTQFLRGVHERYQFQKDYYRMLPMHQLSIISILPAFLKAEVEKGPAQGGAASGGQRGAHAFPVTQARANGNGGTKGVGGGIRHKCPPGYKPSLPHKPQGGGGTACHNCGVEGHRWFECPKAPKFVLANAAQAGGGGGPLTFPTFEQWQQQQLYQQQYRQEQRQWQMQQQRQGRAQQQQGQGGDELEGLADVFRDQAHVIHFACSLTPATLSYLSSPRSTPEPGWAIDSGCTKDMSWDRKDFAGPLRRLPVPIHVRFGNGAQAVCRYEGTVHLQVKTGASRSALLVLPRVLFVPTLTVKLLSVLQHSGTEFTFTAGGCIIRSPIDREILATGTASASGLYVLDESWPVLPAALRPLSRLPAQEVQSRPALPTTNFPLPPTASRAAACPPRSAPFSRPNISPPFSDGGGPGCSPSATQHSSGPSAWSFASFCGAVHTDLWHRRFAHLGIDNLHQLSRDSLVVGMPHIPAKKHGHQCTVCDETQLTRPPFQASTTRPATFPADLLHMDLCSTGLQTHDGMRYVATVTDDASRYSYITLLKFKDGALAALEEVVQQLETQLGRPVKAIRSDGGGEYINKAMTAFCTRKGILQQSTLPYSPQSNGVAERLNRTLLQKVRAMLRDSHLPLRYWGEAMHTANYLRNRSPCKHHGKTPFEVLTGHPPDVSNLRVFGSTTMCLIPNVHRDNKVGPVALPGQLLGYCPDKKGYRVLVKGAIYASRDVRFDERVRSGVQAWQEQPQESDTGDLTRQEWEPEDPLVPPCLLPPAVHTDDHRPDQHPDSPAPSHLPAPSPDAPLALPTAPVDAPANMAPPQRRPPAPRAYMEPTRRSGRQAGHAPIAAANLPRSLDNLPPSMAARPADAQQLPAAAPSAAASPPAAVGPSAATKELEELLQDSYFTDSPTGQSDKWGGVDVRAMASVVVDGVRIPQSRAEALASPEADRWMAAIADEWGSLVGMGTWTECAAPPGVRTIGVKWVFDLKTDSAGKIVRYKARLVAKGYSQVQGVDYTELFAPVSKYSTMRLLTALATHNDWHVHQLDVKTAFLHGTVEEDLYIQAPEGYALPPGRSLKLNKSLYGLKQASRNWWKKLDALLTSLGGVASAADPCLYTLRRDGKVLYVLVYVDDCQLFSADLGLIMSVKQQLLDTFTMTDLGESTRFLGIDITRDRAAGTTKLSQAAAITALAETYGQLDSKPHYTPLPLGTVLEKLAPGGVAGDYPMAELVGSLNYIAQTTRPDIAYAVGALGRHTTTATSEHWKAALHVLAYLYTTRASGITYHKAPNSATPFTVTGLCDSDYGGDVATRRSTTGYAFQGAGGAITWSSKLQPTVAASTTEAEYMAAAAAAKEGLWLRTALYDLGVPHPTMLVGCDNQAALAHIKNPIVSLRAKHVGIHHHFVRERVEMGHLHFHYVPTASNASDVLTKPLGPQLHKGCLIGLGME